jgi:hypothetical protein
VCVRKILLTLKDKGRRVLPLVIKDISSKVEGGDRPYGLVEQVGKYLYIMMNQRRNQHRIKLLSYIYSNAGYQLRHSNNERVDKAVFRNKLRLINKKYGQSVANLPHLRISVKALIVYHKKATIVSITKFLGTLEIYFQKPCLIF